MPYHTCYILKVFLSYKVMGMKIVSPTNTLVVYLSLKNFSRLFILAILRSFHQNASMLNEDNVGNLKCKLLQHGERLSEPHQPQVRAVGRA